MQSLLFWFIQQLLLNHDRFCQISEQLLPMYLVIQEMQLKKSSGQEGSNQVKVTVCLLNTIVGDITKHADKTTLF